MVTTVPAGHRKLNFLTESFLKFYTILFTFLTEKIKLWAQNCLIFSKPGSKKLWRAVSSGNFMRQFGRLIVSLLERTSL